jgi:hypothetical protein
LKFRSKIRILTAAAFGSTLLIACNAAQTKAEAAADGAVVEVGTSRMTVRNSAELLAAVRAGRAGDTILLRAGEYGALALQGTKITGGEVIIASLDPSRPAHVAGIEIEDCSSLTFRDLEVTVNARTQTIFNVVGSSDIKLERLHMHGPLGTGLSGLMFRRSTRVRIADSRFHDVGTAIRNIDSSFVTVTGNDFREIFGDGIQTTGTSNVAIVGNYFTAFHSSPGDHPDAIQFFTLNQKVEAHDIEIKDNVIVRGSGSIVQGIFLGNEIDMAYVNVSITGNKVVGAMWNGIAVGKGRNVTLTDNVVQAYADQGSWIIIEKSLNALASNNRSTDFIDKENRNSTFKDNKRLRPTKVGDLSALGSQPPDGR